MRVGIDVSAALGNTRAGGGCAQLQRLVGGLLSIDTVNEYHIFTRHPEAAGRMVQGRPNACVVNPASIALYAAWRRLDVLHSSRALPAFLRCASVFSVPDINFELYPKDFAGSELKQLKRTRANCARADLVLAGSAVCRRQLHDSYGLPLDKVVVAPAAADDVSDRAGFSRSPSSLGLPERYIVFASGTRIKDNVPRMLAAFDQLISRSRIPHYLVIPASRGETAEGFEYALRLMRNRSRVLVFRNLSEPELHVVLRGADVFACPSLYEGPGVSPMVAQRLDVPCLVSNVGSFPETYGESVYYCDPLDAASIACGLQTLIEEPLLRSELALRGAERARSWTWKHAAAIALDAYQRIATPKARVRPAPAALQV